MTQLLTQYNNWLKDRTTNTRINLIIRSIEEGNDVLFFKLFTSDINSCVRDRMAKLAAEKGRLWIVKYFKAIDDESREERNIMELSTTIGATYFSGIDEALICAAECGHMDIARLGDDYHIISGAARGNNVEVLKKFDNVASSLYYATKKDNKEVVEYLMDYEFTHDGWMCIAKYAVRYGHSDIFDQAVKKIILNYDDIVHLAVAAARGGNRRKLDYLIDLSKSYEKTIFNTWGKIAYSAAKGGHLDIVKLAEKNGYCDYTLVASSAAKRGHRTIVLYAIEAGEIHDWRSIILCATRNDYFDLALKVIGMARKAGEELEDNSIDVIAHDAARYGHRDIVKTIGCDEILVEYGLI